MNTEGTLPTHQQLCFELIFFQTVAHMWLFFFLKNLNLKMKIDCFQLRQEKCRLEQTLEQEQECLVNKLMRKIEKLEAETLAKQSNLEQLRREKVELENTLEQEQEALVNRLWKRMDKLEAEKRLVSSVPFKGTTLLTI